MFIVFEGGEAVGKSTQIELLYQAILSKQWPCIKTREPGGTPLAESIRNLFKKQFDDTPTQLTELHLICAAREQHVKQVIKANKQRGAIILCDRFLDSTYVYQHILGKLPKQMIDDLTKEIIQDLIPSLTFVFDCDEGTTTRRINQETHRHYDRLDAVSKNFHAAVLDGYRKVYEEQFAYPCGQVPKRILIKASNSITNTFLEIKNHLKNYLNLTL